MFSLKPSKGVASTVTSPPAQPQCPECGGKIQSQWLGHGKRICKGTKVAAGTNTQVAVNNQDLHSYYDNLIETDKLWNVLKNFHAHGALAALIEMKNHLWEQCWQFLWQLQYLLITMACQHLLLECWEQLVYGHSPVIGPTMLCLLSRHLLFLVFCFGVVLANTEVFQGFFSYHSSVSLSIAAKVFCR